MPFPPRLSPEQHARDKAKAEKLIANGLVRTWRDLGDAFNLSPAGAAHRFGKVYGLRLPSQAAHEIKAKSRGNIHVELDAMTTALVDQLRGSVPRYKWLSSFLVAQLPKYVAGGAPEVTPAVDLEPVTTELGSISAAVELIGDDVSWIVESLKKALGEES